MEQLTRARRRSRTVIGTPAENLVVEAVMHFFRVAAMQVGEERRWPEYAVDAVGTVINSLPADVRQELLEDVTREYAEYTGRTTAVDPVVGVRKFSPWLPDAKQFVLARYEFLIENRLH